MGKWTLERWIAIACLVFTLGTNWQRVLSRENDIAELKKFNEQLSEHYVPREVYNVNQQHLTDAINKLVERLDKLYALEQETGEPARIQRQFSRQFDK